MLRITDIWDFKKGKDIDALIRGLAYQEDLAVRAEAASALGNLGDKRSVDALISTLKNDTDPYVRSLAATALGNLGDSKAKEALLQTLHGDTLEVGQAASQALKKLKV